VVDSCINDDFSTDSESDNNVTRHQIDEYDVEIEDFISQMDANNKNRTTPLYIGSPISIYEACVCLIRLSQLLNLDKNKMQTLLNQLRKFFPSSCLLPKTIFMLFKITNNENRPPVCLKNISHFFNIHIKFY
jgi:hypothetical protein